MLIVDEGIKLKPYICSGGKLTIGVGRNLTDKGINKETALLLLKQDITEAEHYLSLIFGEAWIEKAGAVRCAGVVNMIFNLGIHTFQTFEKMINCLHAFDFQGAAAEALDSKWAKQVGARAQRVALAIAEGEIDDYYNREISL